MPKVSHHTVLTIVTAAALAAAGCSAPSSGPVGSEPGAMVLGSAYEPESLHPLLGYGEDGASKIFDGLVDHDANREIVPELAAEVPEPSSDGRTWTVKLREGVTFHDGSAFGADDVDADPAGAVRLRRPRCAVRFRPGGGKPDPGAGGLGDGPGRRPRP